MIVWDLKQQQERKKRAGKKASKWHNQARHLGARDEVIGLAA